MTTAKHKVSIELQHENCYSGSNMKLAWEFLGLFFLVGEEWGRSKFSASRRGTPLIFPSREETVEKLYFHDQILINENVNFCLIEGMTTKF